MPINSQKKAEILSKDRFLCSFHMKYCSIVFYLCKRFFWKIWNRKGLDLIGYDRWRRTIAVSGQQFAHFYANSFLFEETCSFLSLSISLPNYVVLNMFIRKSKWNYMYYRNFQVIRSSFIKLNPIIRVGVLLSMGIMRDFCIGGSLFFRLKCIHKKESVKWRML